MLFVVLKVLKKREGLFHHQHIIRPSYLELALFRVLGYRMPVSMVLAILIRDRTNLIRNLLVAAHMGTNIKRCHFFLNSLHDGQ